MRVAMLNVTGGNLSGGYRKYLQHVVPLLRQHAAVNELFISLPPAHVSLLPPSSDVHAWKPGEQWLGFPSLRREVRAWKPDVVFIPTARVVDCDAPCVSMVRNMQPMIPAHVSDGVSALVTHRLRKMLSQHAVRRATRVIAVSQFVKDFLVQQWRVPPSRVAVVPHGVNVPALTMTTPDVMNMLESERFLFAAGSLLPYRALEDAIGALACAQSPDLLLAVAGVGSPAYRNRLRQLAVERGVAHRVCWLGHVKEEAMRWGFQQCVAFVMTSRVEACPNVALEAMADGALCLSTRFAPMPEVFGDCAWYYDGNDVSALGALVDRACMISYVERAALREAVVRRASGFRWEATVNATVEQLQLAMHQM